MKRGNPNYRSREELIQDVIEIIKSNLKRGTKYYAINDIIWRWTEFDGKYKGCKYWSKNALEEYEKNNRSKQFRHEHVIPRKVLLDYMVDDLGKGKKAYGTLQKEVREIFEKCVIATVITIEEDKGELKKYKSHMPRGKKLQELRGKQELWSRYKELKEEIDVIEVKWSKGKVIVKKQQYLKEGLRDES